MDDNFRTRCQLYARLHKFKWRIKHAQVIVAEALEKMRNPYIAFSGGGKDSSCVAHLVWQFNRNIPAVYLDADCAFPESETVLTEYEMEGYNIIRWKTEPFLETLRRVGILNTDVWDELSRRDEIENETMRTTVYRPIKALLSKHSFDGVFIGLRAEESKGRKMLLNTRGELFWHKRDQVWMCQPIAEWEYMDVWAYIVKNEINYCKAYDKQMALGLPPERCRLSYWAGESGRRSGRWAILKRGWPKLFNQFAAEFPEVRTYT